MDITSWTVKDIRFHVSERRKATNHVLRLVKTGWDMNEGDIESEGVFGEIETEFGGSGELIPTGFEAVQLIKTNVRC
jgi:hypothetical protein